MFTLIPTRKKKHLERELKEDAAYYMWINRINYVERAIREGTLQRYIQLIQYQEQQKIAGNFGKILPRNTVYGIISPIN